jgi:hypothetical protein
MTCSLHLFLQRQQLFRNANQAVHMQLCIEERSCIGPAICPRKKQMNADKALD